MIEGSIHFYESGCMPAAVSLIIAVYKKPDFLEKVFLSCANQTFRDFEIVVADDGSDNQIADVILNYRAVLPMPIRHVWHEDSGFRKTVIANEAVARASGEYLLFIDGDSVLHHRFVERHHRHRRKGTVLAGRRVMLTAEVTAALTNDDIRSRRIERPGFWWNGCLRRQRKHGFYIPGSFAIENTFKKRYWIIGANFSMFKENFAAINGYDETITGRGGEDINLTERVRLAEMPIRTITREALQYHLFHRSDPVPHDDAAFERLRNPAAAWAEQGLSGHFGREESPAV
ncbi:MAG: glycosyltransferase [Chitinispirillaceae bacterium]|nr:glycosyltransferase [Chitinispirillaceae bacterium]